MTTTHCYIGLGSNLASTFGNPFQTLQSALHQLALNSDITDLHCSPCYLTKPVGPQNQNDFHNAVARFNYKHSAETLLELLQQIEHQHGRRRANETRWGARTLDLDLLLFGNQNINSKRLIVPHPEIENRAFVLIPLYDITPELVFPNGKKLESLAENCQRNGIIKLTEVLWLNQAMRSNEQSNLETPIHKPAFIAIEGAIGVGKTTLCKRIAEHLNADLLLEQAELNPFLAQFYANPKQYAFQTQLFFLMQRAQQVNELRQNDMFHSTHIADFLIDKDKLFARVNLNSDEYKLYMQVYEHLTINAPKPDLVVYLQAPSEVLMQRIQKRGIKSERSITHHYLQQVSDAYTEFFHFYNDAPLLIINATDIDFANSKADFEYLLNAILNTKSGRHFINPQPQSA